MMFVIQLRCRAEAATVLNVGLDACVGVWLFGFL